jgi:carboxymethylenebutenolidase
MCDQDHAETTKDFEARGWVTRRQFGALLGAGMAMALPQVVGAVAVTDGDVTIKTPDGTCDAYFVHPATGTGAGVLVWPDIFGLRPAFRTMGKRLAENGYSVLVVNPFYRVQKAPTAAQGAATPDPVAPPAGAGAERDDARDRRQGVHRVARSAAVGREEPQDRARRATAWAARWRSARRPRPTASARWRRSTAAAS